MKIWVFVPVYNRADLLRRCVESLACQDDENFEVVIADDCSTDHGVDGVLQQCLKRGWRVIRRNKNLGATLNIRESIRWVQTHEDMPATDAILLVDGDDRLARPDAITCIREAFTDDVDVVYGSYIAEPPDDGCPPARPIPPDILEWGMIRAFTRDHGPFYNHPLAFRRRVFDVLRDDDFQGADGKNMKYGYDTTLMVPILEAAGERVAFLDETLYVYTADRAEAVHRVHTEANQLENWWVTSQPRKYQPLGPIQLEEPCESQS